MRLLACLFLLAFVCLGHTGCAALNKNKSSPSTGSGSAKAPPKFPTGPSPSAPAGKDPLLDPLAKKAGAPIQQTTSLDGSILAGQIIDRHDHSLSNGYVQVVALENGKQNSAPVDIPVNVDGYFTIQGLKPGASYKLIARAKNGERLLANTAYATAPNIRVVIQVKEEFVTAETPPMPGTPAFQGNKKSDVTSAPAPDAPSAKNGPGWSPAVGLATPNASAPAPTPPNPGWTPGPAPSLTAKSNAWPPTLEIPGPPTAPTIQLQAPQLGPEPANVPAFNAAPSPTPAQAPARVPSCVLVGRQVVNFALNDIHGQPFEYRTGRKGKVVLLDFWATFCMPCLDTIPKLRALQGTYGAQGLEVIGIAYEAGGTPQDQARRIASLHERMQTNYRQLLGTGSTCPVRNQFAIHALPTLILLDDNGYILWRHEGAPDRATVAELERLIQRHLPPRAY